MNWSHFLIAIRWQNVMIIWLMQTVVYFRYILPNCGRDNYSFMAFILFLVATAAVLGGGNIYNDIQDIRTDTIHKTKKKIVGQEIALSAASSWYRILTGFSILMLVIGYALYQWQFWIIFIFLLGIGLLYLYSRFLKATVLAGNLLVAFLCALSVWMVTLLDRTCNVSSNITISERIPLILYGYILNAFLITLLREVVKDKEDAAADMEVGIYTIGSIGNAKFRLVLWSILSSIALFNGVWFYLLHSLMNPQDWNLGLCIIFIPLLIITLILLLPKKPNLYAFLSKVIKVYILFAILLLVLWQRI